ncbi:hypothetical protein AAG906_025932 [Vitis piasezkii]
MMVGIDDMEEFKRVFLIFASATLLVPTSRLEGSHSLWYTPREQLLGNINWGEYVLEFFIQAIHEHRRKESVWIKGCLMFLQIFYFSISNFPAMYVELTTPRIVCMERFLVKQRIKLELEMLGGFGKVELVSTSAEQDETEKNKALAWCTFYTNNPQHSPFHSGGQRRSSEDDLGCTNERVSKIPNVEDGVFIANKDPLHPGPHNMLVLVQSCMDNSADVAPQASKEIDHEELTEEETHVAYVFDELKDPSEMLCAYGGYGMSYGMYAILYMKYWDGSGLDRTINSERMSLERLKFATHMVLDSETKLVKWLQLIFGQPRMRE